MITSGVYIFKNWVLNLLKEKELDIVTVDFDLVKLLVNNQFKKKLLKYKRAQATDPDTIEIDDVLDEELLADQNSISNRVYIKSNNKDVIVDANEILRIKETAEDEKNTGSNASDDDF